MQLKTVQKAIQTSLTEDVSTEDTKRLCDEENHDINSQNNLCRSQDANWVAYKIFYAGPNGRGV